MGSHFGVGEFTTQFMTYFSGDWDVHWGWSLLTLKKWLVLAQIHGVMDPLDPRTRTPSAPSRPAQGHLPESVRPCLSAERLPRQALGALGIRRVGAADDHLSRPGRKSPETPTRSTPGLQWARAPIFHMPQMATPRPQRPVGKPPLHIILHRCLGGVPPKGPKENWGLKTRLKAN